MENEPNISQDTESGFNPLHEDPQPTLLLNPGDFFFLFSLWMSKALAPTLQL